MGPKSNFALLERELVDSLSGFAELDVAGDVEEAERVAAPLGNEAGVHHKAARVCRPDRGARPP